MKISFTPKAWEDYIYWQQYDDSLIQRINDLIKDMARSPFSGKGKPEPLRYELKGLWSRRINHEHRIVYEFSQDMLTIVSVRYHYKR